MGDSRRSSGVCTINDSRRNSEIPLKIRQAETTKFFTSRITRKKVIDSCDGVETNLGRSLSTMDITLLAMTHMVGSGVYVLTDTVARNMAGPAIVVSFIITGIISFLSFLSYFELGVRYPKSGSAYSFIYLAIGEVWAFVVGWTMTLESSIGAAATARACSSYIDSLTGGVIRNSTDSFIGSVHFEVTSNHLDFLAVGLLLLVAAYLSFGIGFTTYLTNLFSIVNVLVILFIVGVGAYYADVENWSEERGGFMPYGVFGMLAGSASCFYAFVGFGAVAAAADETKDPQRSIPKATLLSMTIATAGYCATSVVLTLMVNYKDINEESGFPKAFALHGAEWAQIVVVVGAVCGMIGTMIGSLYALTRIVFVMADDGLLFNFCATVNVKTKIPLGSMYAFTVISMLLALLLDISMLVEMMSIGSLFSYVIVSSTVIILRYRPKQTKLRFDTHELTTISEIGVVEKPAPIDNAGQLKDRFRKLRPYINLCPGRLVIYCVTGYVLSTFLLCAFVKVLFEYFINKAWWAILIAVLLFLCMIVSFCGILLHQQSDSTLRYKAPLVPYLPALSIFLNILLVVNLHTASWLRMLFWMSLGLSMYFAYGVEHSKLDVIETEEPPRPRPWSVADTDSSYDARRKAGAAQRAKPPMLTTISREFLFTNVESVP